MAPQLLGEARVITHEALDSLGSTRTQVLRPFLVATGVLPERDARLHALEAWIERSARGITDEADRRSFLRFATWRHLRGGPASTLTEGQQDWRRRELAIVRGLLDSLHTHDVTVKDARQADIDHWLADGTGERRRVHLFLR